MREDINKYIQETEEKVLFYENKLKNIHKTIKYIIDESYEKARKSLNSYKKTEAFIMMEELTDKFEKLNGPRVPESDKSYIFLKIILDNIPFPVFIKDERAEYIFINRSEEKIFGIPESEIIGKKDKDFVTDKDELKIIIESDSTVLIENKSVELPTQSFTLRRGKLEKSYTFKTIKVPFINPLTGKRNILGYSVDVTDTENLGKLKKILIMNSPYL